jgi:hypothetical protein
MRARVPILAAVLVIPVLFAVPVRAGAAAPPAPAPLAPAAGASVLQPCARSTATAPQDPGRRCATSRSGSGRASLPQASTAAPPT